MKTTILNFSGVYENESFYQNDKSSRFVDCRDITGCNCMCDEAAISEITSRIRSNFSDEKEYFRGLHYIDSGNYHYISALYTSFIREPFSLVVLDHHPDMQAPMFDILSCGGWVLHALENNEFIRDVHIIGADKKLIQQVPAPENVNFYDLEDIFTAKGIQLPDTGYPVYLSVDKDVISKAELTTNWDQGDATCDMVISFINEMSHRPLLGVDICGECLPEGEENMELALEQNDNFNLRCLEVFK